MTPDAPAIAKLVAEMRARAQKATPGPWWWESVYLGVLGSEPAFIESDDAQVLCCENGPETYPKNAHCWIKKADQDFMDVAHPTNVLTILDALDAREREVKQANARADTAEQERERLAGESEEARRDKDDAYLAALDAMAAQKVDQTRATAAEARAAKLRETVERLCVAIEPFLRYPESEARDGELVGISLRQHANKHTFTFGDLRRAAAERTRAVAEAEEGCADGN